MKKKMTICEASKLVDESVHTLRYWEKIFPEVLSPPRTKGNQRRYDKRSIDIIFDIKKLLREKYYSTKGAKKILLKKY